MLVLNPWRLALLFLVSGAATRFMLRKYRIGPFLRARSSRLLIPLIFGMLVIVPPQAYEQIIESLGYPAGFLDFYARHYLAFGAQFCRPGPCLLLPTWNHLWFVAYLWVYTMALGVVLVAMPGLVDRIERRVAPALSGAWLLIAPSAAFAVFRMVVLPSFPSTHALFGDWYNHAVYATVFLIGFLLARAEMFWDAIESQRRLALSLAVAVFLSFLVLRWRGFRNAAIARVAIIWRDRIWLLPMVLHRRRPRLRQALADGGLIRTPISDRCDLPLLHRASDRDHHDRARAARQ